MIGYTPGHLERVELAVQGRFLERDGGGFYIVDPESTSNVWVEVAGRTLAEALDLKPVPEPEPEWQACDVVLARTGVMFEAQRNPCEATDPDGLRWYMPGVEAWVPTSGLLRPLIPLVRDGKPWAEAVGGAS